MQAGLGGGSADAAAALQVLARLWGGAPLSLLREVAAGVGSDAPFFLSGGTALGLGRGEEIYPLVDLPRHWVVIVRPPFGVSTVEAYTWYDEDRAAGVREPRSELQILPVPWPTRAAQMVNDLEPPVMRRHPEIGADQDRAARGGRRRRGDVRQRLGGIRAVPHPPGRRPGHAARSRRWRTRSSSATRCRAPSTRARARPDPAPRLTPPRWSRLHLTFSSGAAGAGLDERVSCLARADHGAKRRESAKFRGRYSPVTGQTYWGVAKLVRRGTLDPVFEGSNPSAPTTRFRAATAASRRGEPERGEAVRLHAVNGPGKPRARASGASEGVRGKRPETSEAPRGDIPPDKL